MADTAHSFLARDGGKSARFGCAGAPRSRGFGSLRTDGQHTASAGCSDRISVCRGVVRTQLLIASARSGWARSGAARPSDSHGVRFTIFFCRPRKPAGNCFRGSRRVHSVLARRTAATHPIAGPLYGIDSRRLTKRRCACAPTSRPCRSACEVDDLGVASTKPEYTEVALEARVREKSDDSSRRIRERKRHAVEYPLLYCGHLQNLQGVSVTVTGDVDEGRIRGFERQHALFFQICGMLESAAKASCSDCSTRRSSHRMAQ